jgi:opacity protein-like surface antigen
MRKLAYLVGLFVLATLPAAAQESATKDVTVEYSYLRANTATPGPAFPNFSVNGGSASFAYNPRRWYSIMGEFSGYHIGKIGAASVNTGLFTYMFGPQIYLHSFGRFMPFAQDLFGVAHSGGGSLGVPNSRSSFAMALGGGVDFPVRGRLSLRFGPVDYLLTQFRETATGGRKAQNNLRLSGGIRYRF